MLIQQLLLLVLVMLIWQTTTAKPRQIPCWIQNWISTTLRFEAGSHQWQLTKSYWTQLPAVERFMLMTVRRSLVLLLQLQLIVTICNNYVKLTNVQSNAFNALNTNDIFPMLSLIMLMIAPDFWGSWYWRHLAMQLVTVIFTRRHLNTSNRIIVTQPLFSSVTI